MDKTSYAQQLRIQEYERYLPSAFDESLSILQKMNKIIFNLNELGRVSDNVVNQWNSLIDWIIGNGLKELVEEELERLINDGKFDDIFNQVIGHLDDLQTSGKENIVQSINEIFTTTETLTEKMGDVNNLITDKKDNIVDAINEVKERSILDSLSTLTIGESTGYGIVSGLRVHQQNVLSMGVDIGDNDVDNIVHLKDGRRYTLDNISLPVNVSHETLDRIDVFYINDKGEISYKSGVASTNPIAPTLSDMDVPLAEIYVKAGDTTINTNDITDTRNHKNLSELLTNNKSNVVMAINEIILTMNDVINKAIGDVVNLPTSDKTNIVNAIIEIVNLINDIHDVNDETEKDITELERVFTDLENIIGNITLLQSTNKDDVVSAINSIVNEYALQSSIGNLTDLPTTNLLCLCIRRIYEKRYYDKTRNAKGLQGHCFADFTLI